jgi:hypothetical protein
MRSSPGLKTRIAMAAGALGLVAVVPASGTARATPSPPTQDSRCGAVIRSLNASERHYVEGVITLTYTQLAAAFGTTEVHVSSRPIDSCRRTR